MSFSESLRPLWLDGSLNAGIEQSSLNDWLTEVNNYSVSDITKENVTLRILNKKSYLGTMMTESAKFASAATETFAKIKEIPALKKSNSWNQIEGYYAAYFTIHSLMRLMGFSCSQLDINSISNINRSARNTIGSTINLSTGYYFVSTFDVREMVLMKKDSTLGDKGSHEFA